MIFLQLAITARRPDCYNIQDDPACSSSFHLSTRFGKETDVLLLHGTVKRLVWWQRRLIQLLEILEPLVRPVNFLLFHLVGSDELCMVKAWCNVVFHVQKCQLGGCQARETLALQNNKLDFVQHVFQQMRFHKWNVIRR